MQNNSKQIDQSQDNVVIENEGKRVLVIDDEEVVRNYLTYLLEDAGYSVIQSHGGRDGLNKLSENQIDLVITDISMPDTDGIETIMSIRNKRKQVKIIAMSGVVKKDWYLRIAAFYKADAVIKKPFLRDELFTVIRKACSDGVEIR